MSGDYTRVTFDPFKGFSGLHKQQGRVSLDSEFNEFEEILDRRSRAGMHDVLGETAGQAVVPLTTPAGFQIGIGGAGQLTIGIGRAYVDGILAECFGDVSSPAKTVRDDRLGGVDGSGPLDYVQQPFFYQPGYPALSPTAGVVNLLYLDVWQREVTVFEDDGLREPALNGPDTATRVQTAWQVKVLQNADAGSCATPPASWAGLTAPSTARLSAQAVPAAPAPGPCVINPAGGYTGLENRLYRVEAHRAGTLAGGGGTTQATFKWSRDNASLAARVLSIGPGTVPGQSIITVSSTGRDAWMRFEPGAHIELLDDFVEYAMRESGQGGRMATVVLVNHATGQVHVDQNLTAFAVVAARHPRIRRWDAASAAEPLERNATNGPALALEDGITVTFSGAATDTLHAGDFWVFAARTADGSIDSLVSAPPRGMLHHFARLALVTSGAPSTLLSDCRIFWPRDGGCCTVIVRPGQSIQAAIDRLPAAGGCVCLKAGVHPITATIDLNRSNVHLHGETEGAEIRSPALPEVLHIGGTALAPVHDVMVAQLRIVVDGKPGVGGGMIVRIGNANRVVLQETQLIVQQQAELLKDPYLGVFADDSSDLLIRDNLVQNVFWGVRVDDVGVRAWVNDNRFIGAQYILAAPSLSMGVTGVRIGSDVAGDHRVERNFIQHFVTGIDVMPGSQGAQVIGNRILRSAGVETGPIPADAAALRSYLDERRYGIDLRGGRCVAHGNRIEMESTRWGGIRVLTSGAVVSGNTLIGNLPVGARLLVPASIYCTSDAASGLSGSASVLSGNTLDGPQVGIVVSRVTGVAVLDNRIGGQGRVWFGIRLDDASYTTVAGNLAAAVGMGCYLSDGDHNVVRDGRTAITLVGVLATGETDLDVRDNEITAAVNSGMLLNVAAGDLLISRNRIVNCAWDRTAPGGIVAWTDNFSELNTGTLRIESCEVIESGVAPDGTLSVTPVIGIHVLRAPNCHILGNRVVSTNPRLVASTPEHRALRVVGPLSYAPLEVSTGSALISNNVFRGPGRTHLVECPMHVLDDALGYWFHKIVFTGNYCDHYAPSSTANGPATVLLSGRTVAASANQIAAARGIVSLDCTGSVRNSIVGNVTSGAIVNFATALPGPNPAAFNMII